MPRKAKQGEESEEENEEESEELFELATLVSTIDRIIVSLKRLNETVSTGGDLHTAQKDLLDALAGRQRLEEQDAKRHKQIEAGEEADSGNEAYYDDDDDEEEGD